MKIIKMIMVGDSTVGKSSILHRYVDRSFISHFISTIGIDFKTKIYKLNDQFIKIHLWDTSGQERFHSICQSYYRGVDIALIVYDVTNIDSFTSVSQKIDNIYLISNDTRVVLVANKIDTPHRIITTKQGQDIAKFYKIPFYEISAKTGHGVDEMFKSIMVNDLQYQNQIENSLHNITDNIPLNDKVISGGDDNNIKKCCNIQ